MGQRSDLELELMLVLVLVLMLVLVFAQRQGTTNKGTDKSIRLFYS